MIVVRAGAMWQAAGGRVPGVAASVPAAFGLLSAVIDACSEGVYVKDARLRHVLVNAAACSLLPAARRPDQVLGRTARQVFPAALSRRIEEAERVALAGGNGSCELRWGVADGGERGVLLRTSAWRDARGRPVGVVAVVRDVADGARAHEGAGRWPASPSGSGFGVDFLAGCFAHELCQPLGAAAAFVASAARLLPDGTVEAQEALVEAGEQLRRASDMVRSARRLVSDHRPALRAHDLATLLDRLRGLVRSDVAAAGCVLETSVAPRTGQVPMDATQIQQVLLNLVRNALEAMADLPRGAPRRLSVRAAPCPTGGGVRIEVSDSGPGVAHGRRAALFRPVASEKPGGLGLGLSLCRTILEWHGGGISLRPAAPGGGARFVVTLPDTRQQAGQVGAGPIGLDSLRVDRHPVTGQAVTGRAA